MKRITLGPVEYRGEKADIAQVLIDCLRVPSVVQTQQGVQQIPISITESRLRGKLWDKIEDASKDGHLDLEDADFDFLKRTIDNSPMNTTSRAINEVVRIVLESKAPPKGK